MLSQYNIGRQIGSCADYNGNNTWYFNGNNGSFNNNNRYNGNFRSRPSLDYGQYDNELLEDYLVPLSQWLTISLYASRGKRSKPSYVFASLHRIDELVELAHQVGNSEVMPTESTAHIIHEPRIRQIVCADVIKRDLQAFYIKTLQPYLEEYLYHKDSYSCRPGKGSLRAVMQLQNYIYEASNGYTEDVWIAKVDIQAFFMSLDCFQIVDVMVDFIDKHIPDERYKNLLKYLTRITYLAATKDHLKDMSRPDEKALLDPRKSMYNCPYYRGVPIGDWTSQTAGLVITTALLLYLESLGYTFVHYTDDTCVVVKDKERWLGEDLPRLERLYNVMYGLTLHPHKRYLQHYSKGVELLGYKVRFNRILPSNRIVHNIRWYMERTVRKVRGKTKKTPLEINWLLAHKDKILSSVNSYLGMLRHLNAWKLRCEICETIKRTALGIVFEPEAGYKKIIIKENYTDRAYYRREYRKLKTRMKWELLD